MSEPFNLMYRGEVIANDGTKGRCKVFVPGVHPNEYRKIPDAIPYAEPAMGFFGGNAASSDGTFSETGTAGWPAVGSHVWVFFEQGDHMLPVYFATCQGGDGWISTHNKQWSYQTPNVRIRIDEDPTADTATSGNMAEYDSYNRDNVSSVATPVTVDDIPTRIAIDVTGNVNIVINGSLNMKVTGNVYEEVHGDKYETVKGSVYRKIKTDLYEEIDGDVKRKIGGNLDEDIGGSSTSNTTGAVVITGSTIDLN
jgi:hypothetical protein